MNWKEEEKKKRMKRKPGERGNGPGDKEGRRDGRWLRSLMMAKEDLCLRGRQWRKKGESGVKNKEKEVSTI